MLLRQIPIKELINAKLLSLFMHHSSQLLVSTIRINLIVFRVGKTKVVGMVQREDGDIALRKWKPIKPSKTLGTESSNEYIKKFSSPW